MTAAAYATDLATVTADTTKGTIYRQDSTSALTTTGCLGTLTHGEPTGSTAGGLPTQDTDYFILGVATADKSFNATGIGGLGAGTTNAASLPTDGAFLFWQMFTCPNSVSAQASGGIQALVGSSLANYYRFYVDGDDTHPYGGWKCNPINPTVTASATQGTPSGTNQYFGVAYNVDNAVAKGNPAALGAIRFGRCYLLCTGGDLANGYATFTGAGTFNDYNDGTNGWNRLGLMQPDGGSSYKMQGLFQMGSAATAVDFRDSNKTINIQATPFVTANFNTFEVQNATSRVDWTGISISALGTVSKGRLLVTDNADINFDNCTFTDMDAFTFQSASTVLNTTFRRCGLVTVGGGTFTGCKFDQPSGSIGVTASSPANAALISNATFTSDGTGHGLEITGTVSDITLTNITWTGYAASDGSTGNEAIFVNIASGIINISISGGTTPSIRTAGATVNVISGAVSVTATVSDATGAPIQSARVFIRAAAGGPMPYDATVTIVNSGTTATVTHTAHGMATNDKVTISGASLDANNGIFSTTKINNDSYSYTMASTPGSSPTGTIKSTYVVLHDLTNVNGQVTMSRVFSSAQPYVGWARKSSSAPYYKQGAMSGTISSSTGATPSAVLVSDD